MNDSIMIPGSMEAAAHAIQAAVRELEGLRDNPFHRAEWSQHDEAALDWAHDALHAIARQQAGLPSTTAD